MVTIPTGLAINTATVSDRANALSFRRILGALFKQTSAGNPVAGIMPGPNTPLDVQTSPTSMQYYVKAGYAVTARTNQGAYLVGNQADVTLPVSVGNATNPRYDRIYIVQPDPELGETGQARIDVVQGTPAAAPSVPALPTGALELGRKLVPAGASNTGTGTAVSNKAPNVGFAWAAQISDVAGLQTALDNMDNLISTRIAAAVPSPTTGTFAYGSLYRNSSAWAPMSLTKTGNMVRLKGHSTNNVPITFAGTTIYQLGTLPTGYRPTAQVMQAVAVSPVLMGEAWIIAYPSGALSMAFENGATLNGADQWVIGYDIEWSV